MEKIIDKLKNIKEELLKIYRKNERKLSFEKLKLKCYIRTKYMLLIDSKWNAILYIGIILVGLLVSYCLKINYNIDTNSLKNYHDLFRNTGIALIGLSGIIFTLQIFSQESQNDYMNSVMEKIVDIRAQHIVEYLYLCFTTIIFLMLSSFPIDINIMINYYYISLITIFILLGIDLFSTTRNSNKYRLLQRIEKRVNRIVKLAEKECKDFDYYSKKYNQEKISLVDNLNGMNSIFVSQIQCINLILRNSIEDSLLFTNGMDVYINIIKERLEKRKNKFTRIDISFLNEVLPNYDNDSFIEKYMIEYLDEYAKNALNNRNRDILAIIQNTFHKILILGKDNRYNNSNELELTIKMIFIYYLELIKDIVIFNNENMLFDTVEIFKDLFIRNGDSFRDLINQDLYDKLEEISDIALNNKSLMNFRNIQALITVTLYTILNEENELKSYDLKNVFKILKYNCIKFTEKSEIKRYDNGRIYLNYIFCNFEPYSVIKFLENYYSSNIKDNEFVSEERFDNEEISCFVGFFADKSIITCLSILKNRNIYVTGPTDLKYSLAMIIQLIFKLLNSQKYNHIESELRNDLFKCFKAITDLFSNESSYGKSYYELNNFFNTILINSIGYVLNENENLKNLYIKYYCSCIKEIYNGSEKGRINIEYLYEILNYLCYEDKTDEVMELIEWYLSLFDNKLSAIYDSYKTVSRNIGCERKITSENIRSLREVFVKKYFETIKSAKTQEIDLFIEKYDLKIKSKNRREKIDELEKLIK